MTVTTPTRPDAPNGSDRISAAECALMFPASPIDPVELKTFARLVDLTGMRRLYCGQTPVFEPHTTFGRLVGGGCRTPLGTAVTLMPLRHPVVAASQARELAVFSGQSYVAGLGLGSRALNEAWTGSWPASPLTYVREYATAVRGLLDGEDVALDGRYVSLRASLRPHLPADVRLALGVLRPRMTELAGEVADLGVSWLTPPSYCAEQLVPALERGARDRDVVPGLAVVVNVAVDRPGRDHVDLVKANLSGHLAAPHYNDALARAGYDIVPGDVDHNAREVVDRGLLVHGSPAEIATRLQEYRDAGVDEVLLNPGGVYLREGGVAALRDLQEITEAMAPAASGPSGAPA